jgi:enoyl-CoA hydratase/carnithine racemase
MRNDDDGGAAGGDGSGGAAIRLFRLTGGKANAMDGALLDDIERQIDELERGPARAAVLTGYERFFSAGLALPRLVDLDRAAMRAFIEHFARAMRRVLACETPIVAAINGHAIAGGCVLALMCDWRICADGSAKIGLNETQLGIGLPAIVIEPLRAQVPPASLVRVALEGRLFLPREAHAIGLVHEVVAPDALLARAEAKARELAAPPPVAVAQVKRALRAPILEAIARTAAEETERWLDSWFTDAAQARLRAAVAGLGGGSGGSGAV